MSLFGLIKFIELITVIIGSIYFKKYAHTFLKYFLILLWFVTGVEFAIWGMRRFFDVSFQNNFIYNIVTSIQYVYYFLLYRKIIKRPNYKRWVRYFLIAFILSVIVTFVWIPTLTVNTPFHSYTFTIGAILLLITIGLFFVEILNSEKVLYFKRYLMFWISVGLVLFYTGMIPLIISLNFLPTMFPLDLSIIMFTLNLMMYGCFSVGFIVSHKFIE